MPVYYDMLVSQSPPIFSHSPPTGFLSDFASNNRYESPRFCRPSALTPPTARRHFSGQQPPPSLYQTHLQNLTPIKMPIVTRVEPKRSCLVVRPGDHKYCTFDANGDEKESDNDESSDSDERGTRSSSSRSKRRVVFADDKGLELEHVKVMSEASNQPPTWSLQFLAHVTQGMISPVPLEQWTIDFRQPASDYLEFRRKLETKNVSLENVIIKESECTVVGTVKVKNLGYNKEVFIRASWDDWKTQVDTFCTYSQILGSSGAYVIYDTFSFKLTLPPQSRHLEFCVGYRADDNLEFWDNNMGANYILTNRISTQQQENEFLARLSDKFTSTDYSNGNSPVPTPNKRNVIENSAPYWLTTLKSTPHCDGLLI